ncbi:MAG: bifunctional oligoribonuclease/PAP phosphatase NrnA [Actinobacteria bacterium]|nr:bifunctional oligoribonuclease/PAP phosphatase NrnA [Actinomycetota bacterium]MCA1720791.1 bifunctional oligoribonuclease/PAP phosphatase NrnA [Actinomycetota bacterium]
MTEQDWAAAIRLLEDADEVALLCHVGPDGDALGSMLGLGAALRSKGTRVVASFGDPEVSVPSAYSYLPAQDLLVAPEDFPVAPRLLVTFDTGSADRLGSLADRLDTAGATIVLDHHASNTRYGTVNVVEPTAAATAVLVADVLERLGIPLTAEIAAPLYTGLVTDTGSFKFAATTPAVHELAARLLQTGIRHDLISRSIWDTTSLAYVRLLGEACARAQLDPDAAGGLGLVWTAVSAEDLARYGLEMSDVEGVIDVLRKAAEAEVAVVLKEEPATGALRVSTRSKGLVDVGNVCVGLGGGGHRFAAGYTSYADVPTTLRALTAALQAAPHLPT